MDFLPKVKYINPSAKSVKAVFSLVINDSFVVHGIRVINGKKGIFVAMPNRVSLDKGGKKEYLDLFHPLSVKCKEEIDSIILREYSKLCDTKN